MRHPLEGKNLEAAVTRKSALWRLMQSWWILLTFTMFFNWTPFLYIAGRTKNNRWALWGLVYAIPFMLTMANPFPEGSVADDNLTTAIIIGCLISIIHAFSIRKEFLLRLEARQLLARGEDEALLRKIEADYGVRMRDSAKRQNQAGRSAALDSQAIREARSGEPPASAFASALPVDHAVEQTSDFLPVPPPAQPSQTPRADVSAVRLVESPASGVLDLNSAAEEEIADLPGVGAILAKKAIQVREENGGFRSTEQFFEALRLKPRVIERIRPLVVVRDAASPPPPPPSHGRRVVDY